MEKFAQAYPFVFILLITVLTAVGDAFLKKSSQSVHYYLRTSFMIGLYVYISTAFLWIFAYKFVKFSISGAVYSILTMLLFITIGILYFHETLSKTEWFGVFLALCSVFLLSRKI